MIGRADCRNWLHLTRRGTDLVQGRHRFLLPLHQPLQAGGQVPQARLQTAAVAFDVLLGGELPGLPHVLPVGRAESGALQVAHLGLPTRVAERERDPQTGRDGAARHRDRAAALLGAHLATAGSHSSLTTEHRTALVNTAHRPPGPPCWAAAQHSSGSHESGTGVRLKHSQSQ